MSGDEQPDDVLTLDAQLDPKWSRPPSGGSSSFDASDKWAAYGMGATLTDSTLVQMDWTGAFVGGTELLAYADPTAPTVLVTGLYAVYIDAGGPSKPSGAIAVQLDVDADGNDFRFFEKMPFDAAETIGFGVGGMPVYCPAGGSITITARQDSGVSVGFFPSVMIQRTA